MRAAFAFLFLTALASAAAAQDAPALPPPPSQPQRRQPSPLTGPARYLCERLADLLDIVELNVGAGPGAKLDLHYGIHFFGLGDVRSRRIGILDRRVGYWRELDTELGILPVSLLACPLEQAARRCGARQLAQDARFVLQAGTDGFRHLDRKELNGDPEFILKDTADGPLHTRWGDSFALGGEVHLQLGARVFLRPLQLVDFLVGFVGIELDPWLAAERQKR